MPTSSSNRQPPVLPRNASQIASIFQRVATPASPPPLPRSTPPPVARPIDLKTLAELPASQSAKGIVRRVRGVPRLSSRRRFAAGGLAALRPQRSSARQAIRRRGATARVHPARCECLDGFHVTSGRDEQTGFCAAW